MTLGLPQMSFVNEPLFSGQAIIHNDAGAFINPWSISKSEDGGFYVTGALRHDGWAVKTDAKGDVLWRYDLRESTADVVSGYKHNQFVVLRKLMPNQTPLSNGVAIDFIEIK